MEETIYSYSSLNPFYALFPDTQCSGLNNIGP